MKDGIPDCIKDSADAASRFPKIAMRPYDLKSPHSLCVDEAIKSLATGSRGLSSGEAADRLRIVGPNELPAARQVSLWVLAARQFRSWLVIMLIIAAAISALAGQWIDMWVIIAVVIINAAIGFSQEYRAERAVTSLRTMMAGTAKVLRDGKLVTVLSSQLVPGDVMVLEEGDSIAADGRIIVSKNFRTLESSLTGESLPVSKTTEIFQEETPMADRKNMAWKGTFSVGGFARVLVTGTGLNTAIGDISEALGTIKTGRTGFLKKTDELARQMSYIAIGSALAIFVVGFFFRRFVFQEILLTSIAALVAAVPEGLPAVISIVLAIGARRMARRNAIIREFAATETLGAVSAIMTDKTGTLTQNSLTVRKVHICSTTDYDVTGEGWSPVGNFVQHEVVVDLAADAALRRLLKTAAISNNAHIRHDLGNNSYELIGDPTEGALLVLARKGGLNVESLQNRKTDDLPFDSTLRYRATAIEENGGYELHVIGAPEEVLKRSVSVLVPGGEIPLNHNTRKGILEKVHEWSDLAYRVIALAYRKQLSREATDRATGELVFAGLAGMIDPPRPDAREAVLKCRQAGIRVVMVTGDHINTAVAIARATGIVDPGNEAQVNAVTEAQLNLLDDEEFDNVVRAVPVFARLTPRMKLRIAERLQHLGHLIAMTGDGVNDAPALKKADVGVSMGIMGTDVARDASVMVLADDNFATIVNAVEEGRIVFMNARQTSFFLVTTNIAESVTLLVSILWGLPLPLLATQILWLNLVTDGVTALALATEPGHGNIMNSRPIKKDEAVLNREVFPFLIVNVLLMAFLSLTAFYWYLGEGLDKARTAVFVIMSFTQLFNVFNLRSLSLSVFSIGMASNKYINQAIGVSILLLLAITQIPVLAEIFHFQPLPAAELLTLVALSSSVLWAGELIKHYKRRMHKTNI